MYGYSIEATSTGPVVLVNKHGVYTLLTLQDVPSLFDIAEEHKNFIDILRLHITRVIKEAFDEVTEAFESNIPFPASRLYAYIQAMQQFLNFANVAWPNYQKQIASIQQ